MRKVMLVFWTRLDAIKRFPLVKIKNKKEYKDCNRRS